MAIRSMTGFGVGMGKSGNEEVLVEAKSVNHKFCEVKVRLPRELASLETHVVGQVKSKVARGFLEVFVKRQTASGLTVVPTLNVPLAKELRRALSELAREVGVEDDVSVRDLILQPGVLKVEEPVLDAKDAAAALDSALGQALDRLLQMRSQEGVALAKDLEGRLSRLEESVSSIASRGHQSIESYRARLEDRIGELSKNVPIDPARLAQEVAFFAERTDVAEELTRLGSHFSQFRSLLQGKEPAGRKMDFLVQEMHREVNTIGSKSQDAGISQDVLGLKAELERIREQVQNVE